jgi:thiamine biosynthesis lipoprotein
VLAHSAERVAGESFPALGGVGIVQVTEPGALPVAREAVLALVEQIDLACSRFREDSELSRLNAASGETVAVGPLLLDALLESLRGAEITGGAVDPTIGAALVALGYDRSLEQLRDTGARRPRLVGVPGWRSVRVDPERATVRVPRGVRIDLGATAKALAADRAAAAARAAAGCGVLVALGGDIAMAGEPPAAGWRVRVTDDHRAGVNAPGQWISLAGGGLASSSTTVRRWRAGPGEAHHLIDPATGQPATVVWRTVSVAAATCVDANLASTAAIVRPHGAPEWLTGQGLPARLVAADGTVRHVAGWPREGEELALR